MSQGRFWVESEVQRALNHRSLLSWWQGFAIGVFMTFLGCVLLGLYL